MLLGDPFVLGNTNHVFLLSKLNDNDNDNDNDYVVDCVSIISKKESKLV